LSDTSRFASEMMSSSEVCAKGLALLDLSPGRGSLSWSYGPFRVLIQAR
jgi:hypothetical protein